MNIDKKDDLVLHEGDGKIRRPSTLKTSGKNVLKLKKIPSPRKPVAAAAGGVRTNQRQVLKAGPKRAPQKSTKESEDLPAGTTTAQDSSNEEFEEESCSGDSSVFEDWDDDDRRSRSFQQNSNNERNASDPLGVPQPKSLFELTSEDIEICRRLDDEYERALEERDIGYNARYSSVRQTAVWSIFFLVFYMAQGTIVYRELLLLNNEKTHLSGLEEGESDEFDNEFSNWSIPESLFFSIFTITTVGYGREDLPTTPSFQAYTILYIMVGIAALTIMVAQVYQCIALEASRARLSQDKQAELRRRSGLMISNAARNERHNITSSVSSPAGSSSQHSCVGGGKSVANRKNSDDIIISSHHAHSGLVPRTIDAFFRRLDRAKYFFRENELGRGISVVFPFAGMILSGACVVCLLEGWTFLESLYFAVVSLTTVGFGDYVPTKLPTIWFCIFWLPFSIGFTTMYLSNVATFYIRLSDRNIRRIERNLRRRLQKAKEKAEEERAEVLRRAYRGQETEIEIAAGGADGESGDDLHASVDLQRSSSHPGNRSYTSIEEDFQQATIPMNHARSVLRRKKQDGFNMLPTTDDSANSDDETVLIGIATAENNTLGDPGRDSGYRRRQKIIENCRVIRSSSDENSDENDGIEDNNNNNNNNNNRRKDSDDDDQHNSARTMKSMKDVIRAVRNTLDSKNYGIGHHPTNHGDADASNFMSIQSTQNMIDYSMFRRRKQSKKPSFALRVLVQERFAEIIAIEVAGYHSSIEIKDHTLSVTIDSISETAEKWFVPRRARKAFKTVAFEILYFVGEHGLITRGAGALYELTPFEFHGLFSVLVAAMGDADVMEGWLAKTDTLALVDLQKGVLQRSAPEAPAIMQKAVFSID